MSETVIDVRNLQMRYGARNILDGVDLELRRGEVLAVLGPNGAGKSTTIEILQGFRTRTSGHVNVLGVDPAHADEGWRARVGIVLQSWRDHPKWRVAEFLAYQGSYYRRYSTADTPRPWSTPDLLEAVGLTPQADTSIGRLSGGQRRRLDVAVGLVGRPDLVMLDEPTTGFDPEARAEFHDLIRAATDRFAASVLLTTHDLDEAEKLADRVAILAGGRIIADGTPEELAYRIAGNDDVSWSDDGQPQTRAVPDGTAFVRELLERRGDAIRDLEVRRASLERTYLAIVRDAEDASRSIPTERTAA